MNLSAISLKFTEATLDEIIQKQGGCKHTSWSVGDGFKKGDSYLSEVYRIIVNGIKTDGSPLQVSTVVKSMPRNIGRLKTFRSSDFFRNECNFYKEVLPRMMQFEADHGVSGENCLTEVPKCLAVYCDGENDFLALEDLRPGGFRPASRQNGLDLMHCRLIIKKLGKFHALSLAIKDQDPQMFNDMIKYVEETYYAPKFKSWYNNFALDQIVASVDALQKEYGGIIYEEKLRAFATEDGFYDKMADMTINSAGPYSVINHGDCWIPNFLITYAADGTTPLATKLIDFQLARHSSPVLDISFFIYSGTSQELREQHYESLLQDYYDSVSAHLRILGSDPEKVFSREAFDDQLKKYARFGVGMGMESIPFSVIDDADVADLDQIEGSEALPLEHVFTIRPLKTKEGRLRLANAIKHGVDNGYLD